ncbi:MAG: hypothetical protein OYK82_13865 [Gammaproteobacteria bacterium]|nr:hypothetical protein [Gammaproteobacteria bacterium]
MRRGRSEEMRRWEGEPGLTAALAGAAPVRAIEFRPPLRELPEDDSLDAWIDLSQAARALLAEGRIVLLTDDAVGSREEQSLQHLTSSLGEHADLSGVVPFLTCKHTLDYCLLFAKRAASLGVPAITVTGGDRDVGPRRCVERSRDLRRIIRDTVPDLRLGAWVNPFSDPATQVGLLLDPRHVADYYITQVVSHHRMEPLDRFLEESERQSLGMPGLVGVFHYRSGSRQTLARLSRFLPVPVDGLLAEFDAGASPEEITARTFGALAERGVTRTYLSNLDPRSALERLARIEADVPSP